jgi:hypothetical protein
MPLLMINRDTHQWSQLVNHHYASPIKKFFAMGAKVNYLNYFKFVYLLKIN